MMDGGAGAAGGCDFINPTSNSIAIYKEMKHLATKNKRMNDQIQLHHALASEKKRNPSLKQIKLGTKAFISGLDYYEKAQRYFAGESKPCSECIVVQNNWIVSLAAKVYRAKELHHWMVDAGQYYSSTDMKYLVFDNPIVTSTVQELAALKSAMAIGSVLNRTVILPKFHCSKEWCPLNSIIRIDKFDEAFGGVYREHSFLTHPLVPQTVKSSMTGPVIIATNFAVKNMADDFQSESVEKFEPFDYENGMNDEEILQNFGTLKQSIIHFHSMYHAFMKFSKNETSAKFEKHWLRSYKKAVYRQYL